MFGHDNQDNREDEVVHDAVPSALPDPAADAHGDDSGAVDQGIGGFVATPAPHAPDHTTVPATGVTDDLLDIKQEALQALTPLVGQLDQTPEEQFRTTMMMIQASDNHALVKVAYQAAKNITSEKERAQALLDIVNEINYFTQQHQA